jgi:diguanylate cyclase (GGDEF)-like protein
MRESVRPAELGKPALWCVSLGLLAAVCFVDALTGSAASFAFFYLIPIYFAAWYTGLFGGLGLSLLSYVGVIAANGRGSDGMQTVALDPNNLTALIFYLLTASLISRMSIAYKRERDLSSHDYLTGVYNRREFFKLAEIERLRALRYGRAVTLVFIDLDNFKLVNDRFGHAAGDALLSLIGRSLRNCIRLTDLVARLGGDEFVVLLEETDAEAARLIVPKMREALAEQLSQSSCAVTASMGVIVFQVPPSSVDEMVRHADDLMYAAKHGGGDQAVYRVAESSASQTAGD